jgi:hypothetical protein
MTWIFPQLFYERASEGDQFRRLFSSILFNIIQYSITLRFIQDANVEENESDFGDSDSIRPSQRST